MPIASKQPPCALVDTSGVCTALQGQNLYSADGEAYLILQTDGNLVL